MSESASQQRPGTVDVLIQTHNEELNLPVTLASISGWVNRIFVVDSGSTDRTAEVARAAGATFVEHAWEGYSRQKNWALDNLPWESQWILILDADESVSPGLREEILNVVSRPVEQVRHVGFYINRVLIFMGKEIRHCGYFPSWNLRLFRHNFARYEQRDVHEHMITSGSTGYLKNLLIHEDRRGLEHFFAKHNRYSTLEAREIYAARDRWPGLREFFGDRNARRRFIKSRVVPQLPLPWIWRLLYMYILQLGFMDGQPGWVLCNFISSYEFFIHAKYLELRRLRGRDKQVFDGLSLPEGELAANRPTVVTTPIAPLPQSARRITELPAPAPSLPLYPRANHATVQNGKVSVSVIIPTLNEAKNLPRCLDHLRWADEVVIVDSGSTDDSERIAEAYGAKVVQFAWDGRYPKKKNWALRHAPLKHDWVLIVDADEWITPELAEEVERAIKNPGENVGFYINRKFIFMGGWIRHCGYYPSWNLRLIKRGFGEYEQLTGIGNTGSGDNEVHEHVVPRGSVSYLNNDMLHFAFPNIHTFMEKHNRYSNWEAAVQFKGEKSGSAVEANEQLAKNRRLKQWSRYLPFRPTLRFLYSYFWRGGFLDGRPGLVFCRLLSIYEYLSVAKYYELRRAEEDLHSASKLSAVPSFELAERR
jgi:glycosyltransferase involved in cell wall biosynthesis